MKRMIFWVSAILLSFSFLGFAEVNSSSKLIYKKNNIKAYSVVMPDGRRVIVATNRKQDPRAIAARSGQPASGIRTTRTFRRTIPAGGVNRGAQVEEPATLPADRTTRPAAPTQQNGIPVCMWRGMVVSPVQTSKGLVCPSENSPYPTFPR